MPRIPLRRHLFVLVAAGILPLALLAGVGLVSIFSQQRSESERRALEITRALATALDAELQRSLSALQVLATADSLARSDVASFDAMSRRTLQSQKQWLNVILYDRTGQELVNTRYPPGEALPRILERESFEATLATGEPRVGSFTRGRGGRPAFPLRVPVPADSGVKYVLSAIVDPNSILEIIGRYPLGNDGVISVFDSKGVRIARSRAHEQYLGTQAAPSLREMMDRDGQEGTGITNTLEGDQVFTAYTRLPGSGWTVALGLPTKAVTANAARSSEIYGIAVALSLLLGLLAAYLVAHRINDPMAQLREAADALGRGEAVPVPATDIHEVHEVGAAISAAAQRRAAIEAEREGLLARAQVAREEAEAASHAKDQFLAMLGHELRNPLAALSNAASLLQQDPAANRMGTRAREVIQRQVSHLARLTDDLLDAARALLGKIDLRSEPVDLSRVVSQAIGTLTSTGRLSKHRVIVDLDEAWIHGDAVRLDQIACNLLINAVKYTPEGGTITVRTRREGGNSVLIVADDGVGMSPELASRAFELFVQGERGLDRSQGGLGIGLTLVRRLAELHGGRAEVHSDGEGRGSEFTVRFPAAERVEQADTPSLRRAALPRTVLVLEDNDDARETLAMLLQSKGHRVASARDGLSGLDMALATDPDVALVDLGLPGIDGYEFARRIRASGGRAYLVALTGYGAQEDRKRALEAGFDEHVTKPVGEAELDDLLDRSHA